MREVKYIPECTLEVEGLKRAPMVGYVLISAPSHQERLRYLSKSKMKHGETGDQVQMAMDNLEAMAVLVDILKDHVKSVELLKDDGIKISTYEDMIYDPDCESVITELSIALVNGFRPSKK